MKTSIGLDKEKAKNVTISLNSLLANFQVYYQNLRAYLLKRKLNNTTPGATTFAPKVKKEVNKI